MLGADRLGQVDVCRTHLRLADAPLPIELGFQGFDLPIMRHGQVDPVAGPFRASAPAGAVGRDDRLPR